MDRLDAMELFVATIDEGSLSAAARRLGRSPAAASRAVAMLERLVGERLLLRSTRGLRLTQAGERQVPVYREVLARLAEGFDQRGARETAGRLVVTAPELFGRYKVLPVLESFLDHHPKVQGRLLLLDRLVDLTAEGVDLAVRLAPLADSAMVAAKAGEVRRLVCASPAYIGQRGEPKVPADLLHHTCIGVSVNSDRELWAFSGGRDEDRRHRSVQVQTQFSVNSPGATLDAAVRGRGIIRALSYQAAEYIASGDLVALLSEFEPKPVPVSLVFRAHPHKWSPVRMFVDHAQPLLRQELAKLN